MKYLFINSVCGIGSTGRICTDLAQELEAKGNEVKIAYGRDDYVPNQYCKYAVKIGTDIDRKIHALRTRLFDEHGYGSKRATKKFLVWVEKYQPDVLWLHNIHGYYINVEILFDWIKRHPEIQVKWTLHDCWAFTGHCSHFTAVKCEQWQHHCLHCPQLRKYPKCYLTGNVRKNYDRKKMAFNGVKKMTLIVPSKWLADLVKQSFLREYPLEVHYNTIDKGIFKPTPSDFRERYGLQDKKIILGVASTWDSRKGLDDFVNLAEILDEEYAIVLVGLSAKQIDRLPLNIIGIKRTNSAVELAQIYTAADIFVNLSFEETFGLTTMEAISCGTETIIYNGSAGEEIIKGQKLGHVCEQNIDALFEKINNICSSKK